ncbi:SH3 domain-containing protein [Parvibaculum sp.]|uniref:SH3 domain-containing protein n=1 Tax=Parvibaculum sp. TaxID=2024848 RepID=UPI00320CA64D
MALCLLLGAALSPAEAKTAKTEKPAAAQQILPPESAAATPPKRMTGPTSGLPVPRFVSLKSGRINVRRGPGDDYPIEWVFEKKGLPVEITAESDRWRRIRDREGDVGWVWHSMLDGRRTAIVENRTGKGEPVALLTEPNPNAGIVAYAEPGVIAQIKACKAAWCELKASGYEGWVERGSIWGTYSGEDFE